MKKLQGSSYIVKILELLGAKHLFAYPGGAVLPIYDALARSSMHSVLVRHEQAAAFAANGYARVTGKPGFCLSTSGPGATNMVTGIADAYADSIPVIAITGQVATPLIGTDAFQEADVTGIYLPITKRTYLLKHLEDAEHVFREAYETTINGRPGPVLIDIPKDVQNGWIELDDEWEIKYKKPLRQRLYTMDSNRMSEVVDALSKAKKPLIIAGHGNILSDSWRELREMVHREQIPTISTILGVGILASDDPLYFSWLGMHGMKYANLAVQEADLIVALGIRFDDRITGKLSEFAPHAKIIHVDIDLSEGGKNVPTSLFVHADLKLFLQRLPNTLNEENIIFREKWLQRLNHLRSMYPLREEEGLMFTSVAAITTLAATLSDNAIVTTDVGQHQMWAAQYLKNIQPNFFLTSGGLGSMGFGFPAAMGAQAALPDHEVWCISGDGSFQMNSQELITCVQERWPIKILVLDNAYLGMVRQWQEQFYEKNYSGVNLLNPDFVALAKASGVRAVAVENTHELREAIYSMREYDGPCLIHAKVVKDDNVLPMVAPGTSLSETIYYPRVKEQIDERETLLAN